ncbi:MAG: cell division protein FtsL [Magnetococcales bacterium]|nr:cell division protein FtsL [Magnetococcales bacterium]
MKIDWFLIVVLSILLISTAAATVASRMWMLNAHRQLEETKKERVQLLDREQALKMELVFRTDLNTVEQRANKELGMVRPEAKQWLVAEP